MARTVITISIDSKIKKLAQALAADAGLNLNALINNYLEHIAATGRIDLCLAKKMTPKTENLIEESEKEIKTGQTIGPFKNVDEAIKAFKKKS